MTTTSRRSGGSKDLIVPSGRGDSAEAGTTDTPIPAAASCAAVRGLPVRSVGAGRVTPRWAANSSSQLARPLPAL
jgi:hypothetical protein